MSEILDAVKYVSDNGMAKEANILACKVGNIYIACYLIYKDIPLSEENIEICRKVVEKNKEEEKQEWCARNGVPRSWLEC